MFVSSLRTDSRQKRICVKRFASARSTTTYKSFCEKQTRRSLDRRSVGRSVEGTQEARRAPRDAWPDRRHGRAGGLAAPPEQPGHGERSRLQLRFKLGGAENLSILAVNVLAVNSVTV